MANFNSGKNIFVVIQAQEEGEKEKVLSGLEHKTSEMFGRGRYAYILHDKDVLDNGEIKGSHFHVVLCAENAKSSNNWIEHFSTLLGIDRDCVSVEMQQSEKRCLRYLLHLDDGAKHQYDRSEVVTNMDATCKKAWNAVSGFANNPTLEQLLEASQEGYKGLYNLVGLSGFEKARKVMEAIHSEEDLLAAAERRENRLFEEVNGLYTRLASFTANVKFNKLGYIPFKDFQQALDDVSATLSSMRRMREIKARQEGKKK